MKTLLVFFITTFFFVESISQKNFQLYSYSDLSSIYYRKQIDSLKKISKAPKIYNKEIQKLYDEYWKERIDNITQNLELNQYVHSKEIFDYVNNILKNIVDNNKDLIPNYPLLLLDRSISVNAYAMGFNVFAINMGMIDFAQSKEELAFIIAHELSHNILKHPENSDKKRAEWYGSKEYENELNRIGKSEYSKLTQLKNLFKNYTFSRSKHSRFNETSADSLAILLLQNSNMPFNANWLLRLDSSDNVYKQELKRDVQDYFKDYGLEIQSKLFQMKALGLSAKAYKILDTTINEDSLKTHPDCKERFNATKNKSTVNLKETYTPNAIKELAKKIMIWNLFDDKYLTACCFRILLENDKNNKDEWYSFLMTNVFFGLLESTKQNKRFNAINIRTKESVSKSYFQLQNMFEQTSEKNLETFRAKMLEQPFWRNLNFSYISFQKILDVILDSQANQKMLNNSIDEFAKAASDNYLIEFLNRFKIK